MSGAARRIISPFRIGDYSVELEADSRKPAVLHHNTGLVDWACRQDLLLLPHRPGDLGNGVGIRGLPSRDRVSWFDHQWGDFTTAQIGWDWVSLNLDDGSDLMVSVVWEQAERKHIAAYGTYVPTDSAPIHLPAADISLEPTGTWTSSDTDGVYPMGWNLLVDSLDIDLVLTSAIEEAEFAISTFIPVIYWEGAVSGDGQQGWDRCIGQGFVEMVGYVPSVPIAPPPHRPNPDRRLLDSTNKFDDANRIESDSAFG